LTTGTFSPKAIEYNIDEKGNPDRANARYREWRDSYVAFDQERAKKLLDDIGVKVGPNGFRTFPDGSPLEILLVVAANTSKNIIAQNEQMIRDWGQIGIKATLTPVPPQGRREDWFAGKLMSNADWGIGDGPNHLVYPQWLVPIEPERWAPLHGQGYQLRGTASEKEELDKDPWQRAPARIVPTDKDFDPTIAKLHEIYDKTKVEPDFLKRTQMVWEMIKIHVENGPFVQGSVANFDRVFITKKGLMNVPRKEDLALGGFTDPWIHPTPAVYDPEAWYWDDPAKHSG
jgi:peptide/nickel transport system substrate-binding protein